MNQSVHKLSSKVSITIVACLLVAGLGYYKLGTHPAVKTTDKPASGAAQQQTTGKESSTIARAASHVDSQLQQIIDNWATQHNFDSSVCVQELNGSLRTASRNTNTQMTTASTYKIYVAYAVLHQVEQGKYTMQTTIRTGQTIDAALQKMILQSDNTSAEALGFLVGWDTINQLAAAAGATDTNINNYDSSGNPVNGNKLSTAADLTTMVTKLQQGTLLDTSNTQLLLGLMKNQVWRERIPAGVPSSVTVADKPGWLSNVENDAGVVYRPKSTYTLVIMTNGSTTQPLADLSRQIYTYLETAEN